MEALGRVEKINKTFAAFALIGMCSWTFYWFDYERQESGEELAETYARIFLKGVLKASEKTDLKNRNTENFLPKNRPCGRLYGGCMAKFILKELSRYPIGTYGDIIYRNACYIRKTLPFMRGRIA